MGGCHAWSGNDLASMTCSPADTKETDRARTTHLTEHETAKLIRRSRMTCEKESLKYLFRAFFFIMWLHLQASNAGRINKSHHVATAFNQAPTTGVI